MQLSLFKNLVKLWSWTTPTPLLGIKIVCSKIDYKLVFKVKLKFEKKYINMLCPLY